MMTRDVTSLVLRWTLATAAVLLLSTTESSRLGIQAQSGCGVGVNPIVCENQKPGSPASEWDITGSGASSIQGFATNISVAAGQPVQFKINTTANSYSINIYRMGYYGGFGARKVATLAPSVPLPQSQPACLTQSATGLIDCGNWGVSATWNVPVDATSGIYFAKLTRTDNGGSSHIVFIVRDDTGRSDLVFQTSDTTWQAYNTFGGNSLYVGGPGTNPGRAYKVSYNRPFTTRGTTPEDWVFNSEYPMVRWLESNGYNLSYITGVDTDRFGAELLEHKVYLSVGHDEYWSGGQRANVEAARAAGVHLAFFSGNEIFWKTRWEASIDGSNTAYRTLVCYKETHANAKIDPTATWTGTWRDPRFSPPADGGRPENALSGTIFKVNSGTSAIRVPAAEGKARFWRNTSIANLAPGATATLAGETLGYEWDEAPSNASTPSGLIRLSSTTVAGVDALQDFGSTYSAGTVTHNLTLYRHTSGALIFGAGTIQWSWGLDLNHDRAGGAEDVRMEQATVNLFADMGVAAGTLQAGLVQTTASSDVTPPTSTISVPAPGASLSAGTLVTISGTAIDAGGGAVTSVEVSVDGGTTWATASGTTNWAFNWTVSGSGAVTIRSRAYDDSLNLETPSAGVTINVTGSGGCPCTMWSSSAAPLQPDDGDPLAIELGTKFRADSDGFITGVRFYKASANTGTHVGKLWSRTGTLLGSVTFTGETASGWQQANFATPIAITANTTYVVSYHAPNGHYTGTDSFFTTSLDNPPLQGLRDGVDGPNGVYQYGASAFPTETYLSEAYWVDVVFVPNIGPDTTPPAITSVVPASGAAGVSITSAITATFSEAMAASSIFGPAPGGGEGGATPGTFELRDAFNSLVASTVTYDATTKTAQLQPTLPLALSTTYSVLVRGGSVDPRVKDVAGNAMAANQSWSFTTSATPPPPPPSCPCSIWSPAAVPPGTDDGDPLAGELGTRFRADVNGFITGVRFYKATANTGTHTGKLWSNAGTLLGSVTFSGETASGWQQADFATPIAITANTTYVASYFAPNGRYFGTDRYFATAGVDNVPLHALRDGVDGANGVFRYGASSFPTETFQSEGYWVDVVFVTSIGPDTTPPGVVSVTPLNGQSGVPTTVHPTATFNEPMGAASITSATFLLLDPSNATVPATVAYDSATRTATLTPSSPLANSTRYTAVVKGGTVDPRVKDVAGNALPADHTWSFTVAAPPPPPPTQGPGGPVLVVTSPSNLFTTYYAEILRNEGVNAFATAALSDVTSATLGSYDVVILGEMTLTAAQVTMFSDWVNLGGNLIAMRPDKKLAGLLGLTDAGTTLANAYLLVNTTSAPGAGIVSQTIQFHGTADRYTLNGATALATLYSNATTATANPAVTLRHAGAGNAVAFTYDLARSVVYTRQGNPAWSGQERDGQTPIRPDDLFFGAKAGDVQPDWVNLNKVAIPQADEQQRLLWNTILHINAGKKPLPRFWYFPRMLKAAVIMTGDDHANNGTAERFDGYATSSPPGCSVADWECIRATSYLYNGTPLSNAAAAAYVSQGFEIALHVNTNCADYTPTSIANFFSTQLANFATQWPSLPAPATNRTHCIVFSDYATQPQVELNHGIRLDANYYYWPDTWVGNRPGMFSGSGLPMRFASTTGQMIDVYQSTTQITDESGMTYQTHIDSLLDKALGPEGYYVAVDANMHTDFNPSEGSIGSDIIVASAKARGVPVVSARQMLDWLDGRNGSSFQSIAWGGNVLTFNVAVGAGAQGLRGMVPATAGGAAISGITLNGGIVAFTRETIKGVEYAIFAAQAGAYQVSYGVDVTPPVIANVAAAPSASSATITWITNEAADSTVMYGTSPAALSQNAGNLAQVTSHSVILSGLAADTTYYYRVRSADAANNTSTSPLTGDPPATFRTPAPSVSIADASTAEGNAGFVNAAFVVTLSTASPNVVTVDYTTAAGSAAAGADFVAQSGTLTFNPGVTSQTINVLVAGDTLDEPDETFTVTLSNPSNIAIGRAVAVGTIADDDPAPSLTITDQSVSEGNAGITNAIFDVTLSAASGQTVTAAFTTAAGTATAGTDYTTTAGTLTFAPGQTTQSITVPVLGDQTSEADEQFAVNLSAATNASIAKASGAGSILNDDPVPSITIADVSVTEGNSGTKAAIFTLALSAASGQTVMVAYATADGTATSGSDYMAAAGTVTFTAGVTTATLNVTINGDAVSEPDETFFVDLGAATNATVARTRATGTIVNDEGVPALSITDATIAEGNSGAVNAVLTVSLSATSAQTVTVAYATADGTATSPTDYTARSGSLTFAPGVTSQTIAVPIIGDTTTESNETFVVNLSAPTNATVADGQGVVTITNDDVSVVGLVAAYGFEEGVGTTTADKSGSGNGGSISGAAWTTAGHSGKALSFDGVNDRVIVNDAASLDVTRMTLEAWVRPTTLSGWRTVVLKETNGGLAYALYAHDNAPRPATYINTGGSDLLSEGTAALPLNTWSHLAATYDGAALRLYVNGVQVRSRAFTGNITASAQALSIGGNSVWGEYFAGLIDDVRIYNRALTAAEIQTDMNMPVGP